MPDVINVYPVSLLLNDCCRTVPSTYPLPTDLNDMLLAARRHSRLRVILTHFALLQMNIKFPALEFEYE